MLEEKEIQKIRELREKELTVKEIAKAVGRSESSVKKYISDNYEGDEKAGRSLTKIIKKEGYDFEDDIMPLVYSLKNQANEIDITLYDYLKDISNIMNGFLRITYTPAWFYYVFCELANNLSVITDHIEANDLMNAIDNFYNREISMEESEKFLTEIETKTETLIENSKEEYSYYQEKTNELKEEIESLTPIQISENTLKENEAKAEKLLKNTKQELKGLNNQIDEAQEILRKVRLAQTVVIKKIMENPDKNNENLKKENVLLNQMFERVNKLFPEESKIIIQEIGVENQR